MEIPKTTEEVTDRYVFGLLLKILYKATVRTRRTFVYGMPKDWADGGNFKRNMTRWSRALRKAQRLGLVELGVCNWWLVTKKGLEMSKLIKEAGLK